MTYGYSPNVPPAGLRITYRYFVNITVGILTRAPFRGCPAVVSWGSAQPPRYPYAFVARDKDITGKGKCLVTVIHANRKTTELWGDVRH